jgi:hypothetical protein
MTDLGSFSEFEAERSGDRESDRDGPDRDREFDRPDVEATGSDAGVGALAVSEGLRVAEEAD